MKHCNSRVHSAFLNLAYSVARIADAAPTLRRFDPEGAMERGVLQDELAGGDGSKASLARTKAKAKAAADKPMEMPKIDLPKFELPNPFGDKK